MKKLSSIPSYIWAIFCMFLIPITFMGNDSFAKKIATLPFMKVNPVYTGGDSLFSYQQDSIVITVNKPVFAALTGTSNNGYVQVKYTGKLPENIQSRIDYNQDGHADFDLNINTLNGETKLNALTAGVKELQVSSKVKDYWVVRVNLSNGEK